MTNVSSGLYLSERRGRQDRQGQEENRRHQARSLKWNSELRFWGNYHLFHLFALGN